MILATRALLFFSVIWALTSFGFTAGALATLFGQPSYISPAQLYVVTAVSAVSAIVALGLAVLLALHLLGKGVLAGRVPTRAMMVTGLAFCGIAIYSFLIVPTDQYEDFWKNFANGARFEFLLIGVAALIMSVRRG